MTAALPARDAHARVYSAHPLLDPELPTRQRTTLRFWLRVYRRVVAGTTTAGDLVRSLTVPVAGTRPAALAPLRTYLDDTDRYLDDLLDVAPPSFAAARRVLPEIRREIRLDALLRLAFEAPDPRVRYEARRKLYLTRLLFDIDHTRAVRDGRHHRAMFDRVLRERLWRDLEPAGHAAGVTLLKGGRLEFGTRRVPAAIEPQTWYFERRRLRNVGGLDIDLYHYRSRFKREVAPIAGDPIAPRRDSAHRQRPHLGPRSGSILSKMIRRGIADAHAVPDLLGAMFVVGSRRQAYALERRLVEGLGGPFRWRDRVDTLGEGGDAPRLTSASSAGFQVLKQIVDLLVADQPDMPPYHFPVEVQIAPLRAFLNTLDAGHDAAHREFKRRQATRELLPILFPDALFGHGAAHIGGPPGSGD
ncbi:MAG: hypothetical protein AB7H88_09785 [Vicinamibacterales bacterium]